MKLNEKNIQNHFGIFFPDFANVCINGKRE